MESTDRPLARHRSDTTDVPPGPAGGSPSRQRVLVAIALTLVFAAAVAAWTVGEFAHDFFRPRLMEVPKWEGRRTTPQSQYVADSKNAARFPLSSAVRPGSRWVSRRCRGSHLGGAAYSSARRPKPSDWSSVRSRLWFWFPHFTPGAVPPSKRPGQPCGRRCCCMQASGLRLAP